MYLKKKKKKGFIFCLFNNCLLLLKIQKVSDLLSLCSIITEYDFPWEGGGLKPYSRGAKNPIIVRFENTV